MSQLHPMRGLRLARRSISVLAVATVALAFTPACDDGDGVPAAIDTGGSGGAGNVASHAGAGGAAVAGAAGSIGSGDAGSAGVTSGDAGAGGDGAGAGAGDAGAPGEPGQASNCRPGGAPLVVGNYQDAAGNQLLLRTAAKAATLALLPAGAENPAQPPRLFVVNRVCSSGQALLASDESSSYRVDYVQTGAQLAVCWSVPVASLEAALALNPADAAHSAGTGCAGQPFAAYTAEVL